MRGKTFPFQNKTNRKYISKRELASYTPLMNAALENDMKRAFEHVETYQRQFSLHGHTALQIAISCNYPEMVDFLSHYEMGCVDLDNRGVTALMLALE